MGILCLAAGLVPGLTRSAMVITVTSAAASTASPQPDVAGIGDSNVF